MSDLDLELASSVKSRVNPAGAPGPASGLKPQDLAHPLELGWGAPCACLSSSFSSFQLTAEP